MLKRKIACAQQNKIIPRKSRQRKQKLIYLLNEKCFKPVGKVERKEVIFEKNKKKKKKLIKSSKTIVISN